jgi:5-formyltetrahydrofolate cyclo-ligase
MRPKPDGPVVLVGFAESLAAVESAWLLADAGYQVHAFSRHRRPPLSRSGRVRVHQVSAPAVDAARTIADVVSLYRAVNASAVLPFDDEAVWICDHAQKADDHVRVAGPTGSRVALALDKREQIALAGASGLHVPPTTIALPQERVVLPPSSGPWVVKPALAVHEQRGRLGRGRGAVARTLAEVEGVLRDTHEPMLVQQRLAGVGEGVFGYADRGDVVGWSAHRRLRMMNPEGSGSSACRSIDVDPSLRSPISDFLGACDWQGLFMIELLRTDDNTAWFIELNGRTWGSMALARLRGLNYPAWAVSAVTGRGVPDPPTPGPHVIARHVGRELVHLGIVARDRGKADRTIDLVPAMREVLRWRRNDHLYNWRPAEPLVMISDTWQTVRDALRRRKAAR